MVPSLHSPTVPKEIPVRPSLRPATALFALAAPFAAQTVWVVDDVAGPGVDFTRPQDAIDAASDGDVVLVRSGTYASSSPFEPESLTIDGKGLVLVEDDGHEAVLELPVAIRNLAAGQSVTLRGFELFETNLLAEDNQGTVWLEDLKVLAPLSTLPFFPWVRFSNCDSVAINHCEMYGVLGYGTVGGDAVRAENSSLHVYDSVMKGGDSVFFGAIQGGEGLQLDAGGFLFASGTLIQGGDGPVDGTALHLFAGSPTAILLDSPTVSGDAPVEIDSGTLTTLGEDSNSFEVVGNPAREGEALTFLCHGDPGDVALISYALSPGTLHVPLLNGSLLVDVPTAITFDAGVVPASGTLTIPYTVGQLPPGIGGATVYVQCDFLSGVPTLVLGGGTAVTFLDGVY